ncbi:MAG: N-acetylmuramoyl-L-alanine amidase [Bacteriophage sp.]|nr:MAG: N-acetylmuramoyl-L-alanine amidase [Bacteriophage sp.]
MAKKIFLSPSDQTRNRYASGNTSEAIQCGKIALALEDALMRCGFFVGLMHYHDMAAKCASADAWGADLYIPIHTNACNGKVSGTRIYTYDNTGEGRKAGLCVYRNLAPLTPGTSDNISADASLYEIRKPAAPTVYCECEFHDVPETARWIVAHTKTIAEAICRGVCEYFGVPYKAPDEAPRTETLYHVQVGAFKDRKNAEKMLKTVKDCGFEAFIKEEKHESN